MSNKNNPTSSASASASSSSSSAAAAAAGHTLWSKTPKANAELFALTYGALVTEILRDYENLEQAQEQLEKIGYNIGVRCVDELFAKSEQQGLNTANLGNCQRSLKDAAEMIAKMGFRMFLGISAEVAHATESSFSLYLYENPLAIFVELPPRYLLQETFYYSIIYCGVIRGALEQVNLKVKATFVRDVLRGDDVNEIKVELEEVLVEGAGDEYKEE